MLTLHINSFALSRKFKRSSLLLCIYVMTNHYTPWGRERENGIYALASKTVSCTHWASGKLSSTGLVTHRSYRLQTTYSDVAWLFALQGIIRVPRVSRKERKQLSTLRKSIPEWEKKCFGRVVRTRCPAFRHTELPAVCRTAVLTSNWK